MVTPEQPFVFFPEDLDVRWRSFAVLAEQAAGGRRALAELGPERDPELGPDLGSEPGAVVAYRWDAGPDGVAADLAIRSGGWTALPLVGEAAGVVDTDAGSDPPGVPVEPGKSPSARLLLPWEAAPGAAAGRGEAARLPEAGSELSLPAGGGGFPPEPAPDGGALVRETGGAWRRVGAGEQRAAAAELGGRIESALASAPGAPRPVVVAGLDPARWGGRRLLDWGIASRVALYLAGPGVDARFLGGVAGWARPSVVAGDGAALASVAAEIRRRGGAWDRPRWWRRAGRGRLRVAVLLDSGADLAADPVADQGRGPDGGGGRLSADDLALFAHYGVRVVTTGS